MKCGNGCFLIALTFNFSAVSLARPGRYRFDSRICQYTGALAVVSRSNIDQRDQYRDRHQRCRCQGRQCNRATRFHCQYTLVDTHARLHKAAAHIKRRSERKHAQAFAIRVDGQIQLFLPSAPRSKLTTGDSKCRTGIAICFSSNTKGFSEKANCLMLAMSDDMGAVITEGLPM